MCSAETMFVDMVLIEISLAKHESLWARLYVPKGTSGKNNLGCEGIRKENLVSRMKVE